ncbi:MAG: hypothetical protein N4A35_11460 [Flavobacteriales bacterium]|jgi:hypothetical protein|nr:hypothetical protein [Flavobacteriales bacterium]
MKKLFGLLTISVVLFSCQNKNIDNSDVCQCIKNTEKDNENITSIIEKCAISNNDTLVSYLYNSCPEFWELTNKINFSPYTSKMKLIDGTEQKSLIIGDFKQLYPEDIGVRYKLDSTHLTIIENGDVSEKFLLKWKSNTSYDAKLTYTKKEDIRKIGDLISVELLGQHFDTLFFLSKENDIKTIYLSVPL